MNLSEILSIEKLDLFNKRVLLRVDFNVQVKDGVVKDDLKIVAVLPTIKYLLEKNVKLIVISHLGRPEEEINAVNFNKLKNINSMKPIADHLSFLLGKKIKLAPDCIGEKVQSMVNELISGEILMLENLRWSIKKLKEILNESYVVVGGGNSIESYKELNAFFSTGGGASIEFYINGTFIALEALMGNKNYNFEE